MIISGIWGSNSSIYILGLINGPPFNWSANKLDGFSIYSTGIVSINLSTIAFPIISIDSHT